MNFHALIRGVARTSLTSIRAACKLPASFDNKQETGTGIENRIAFRSPSFDPDNTRRFDANTGKQVWSITGPAAINAPDEQNVSQPLTGFAAAEGLLVVPAGTMLSAYAIASHAGR